MGRVPGDLAAAGIGPEQSTDIVLTHLYPDRFGGTVRDGFPRACSNATIHSDRANWKFWMTSCS